MILVRRKHPKVKREIKYIKLFIVWFPLQNTCFLLLLLLLFFKCMTETKKEDEMGQAEVEAPANGFLSPQANSLAAISENETVSHINTSKLTERRASGNMVVSPVSSIVNPSKRQSMSGEIKPGHESRSSLTLTNFNLDEAKNGGANKNGHKRRESSTGKSSSYESKVCYIFLMFFQKVH